VCVFVAAGKKADKNHKNQKFTSFGLFVLGFRQGHKYYGRIITW